MKCILSVAMSSYTTTVKNFAACAYIGGFPHLLQFEFFNASLIWGDGRALDADLVLLDRLSSLDGDYSGTVFKVMIRFKHG